MASAIEILEKNGLRKTNVRLEVLDLFLKSETALAHQQLEHALADVDRITLYRTLKTYEQKGIIHRALDGTQTSKFALCESGCPEHEHHHSHAHFHCEACGKTTCIEEVDAPKVGLPDGYKISGIHLVIQGECADCCQ
ncbi:MAG: transcriptional repressor [Saprospiraceae bacterium]|nr:transcriptional repressor [Saprospiraceae bacterium]